MTFIERAAHTIHRLEQARLYTGAGESETAITEDSVAVIRDLMAQRAELLAALHDMQRAYEKGYDLPWGTVRAAIINAEDSQ